MTIKASQRTGAKALALHLTNANDNEMVSVHEVRGFMSDDIYGAFTEMEANAKGTQCVQHMFSLSINPPIGSDLSTEKFMETADLIEQKMGLSDQPRIVVFHEKQNRTHAHIVWSRIDPESMKAINLPFFKNRLNEIARDWYIENNWELPQGYIDHEKRDPLNYSLQEYQQAQRLDEHPKVIKALFQRCWTSSDNRASFESAIKEHGFFLARGDRRGFVGISMTGEILSLSKWLGVKSKELTAKLGDKEKLPSVDQVNADISKTHQKQFDKFQKNLDQEKERRIRPLIDQRNKLIQKQREERIQLYEKQLERTRLESIHRQSRYRDGLLGLWDRLRGRTKSIKAQNELEALFCKTRDLREWDCLKAQQRKLRAHIIFSIRDVKRDLQRDQRRINQIRSSQKVNMQDYANLRSFERSRDQGLG